MPPRWHPKSCRECGKRASDDEPISAQGYCIDCGIGRMEANNHQLSEHRGPFFDHWRLRTLAAFGGVPLDDPADSA